MKLSYHTFLLLCFFAFLGNTLFGQTINGYVVDEKSKKPLKGVSIYFNGTTNGTITNAEGYYTIEADASINVPLVFSYLGYHTRAYKTSTLKNRQTIYLKEKIESLETVHLESDTWSRKKKLKVFKKEFLGETPKSGCKILNEDDIILVYSPSSQVLSAYSDKPLQIKNTYLGYEVVYHLDEFNAQLHVFPSGYINTESVFLKGTTLYKELNVKVKRKHRKAREKEYKQSILYFMRSLAVRKLEENKFQIFHKRFIVPPYKYFNINENGLLTKITLKAARLVIVYDREHKSLITIFDEDKSFFIDKNGNHAPPDRIYFGGVLGEKRTVAMLPLDYGK